MKNFVCLICVHYNLQSLTGFEDRSGSSRLCSSAALLMFALNISACLLPTQGVPRIDRRSSDPSSAFQTGFCMSRLCTQLCTVLLRVQRHALNMKRATRLNSLIAALLMARNQDWRALPNAFITP